MGCGGGVLDVWLMLPYMAVFRRFACMLVWWEALVLVLCDHLLQANIQAIQQREELLGGMRKDGLVLCSLAFLFHVCLFL